MRGLFAATMLLVSMVGIAHAQGMPDMTPPAEMKAVEFLLGDFSGTATFHMMGQTAPSPVTAHGEKVLNDRYIRSSISYQVSGATVQGMHMLTYDPAAKQYVAYWFDSAAPQAMRMTGKLEGDKLTLLSDPTDMPGMGKTVMRSNWTKMADGSVGFSLEMQQGSTWAPLMEGSFKKG